MRALGRVEAEVVADLPCRSWSLIATAVVHPPEPDVGQRTHVLEDVELFYAKTDRPLGPLAADYVHEYCGDYIEEKLVGEWLAAGGR